MRLLILQAGFRNLSAVCFSAAGFHRDQMLTVFFQCTYIPLAVVVNRHGGTDLVIIRHHMGRQCLSQVIPDVGDNCFRVLCTWPENEDGCQFFCAAFLNVNHFALADGHVFQDLFFNIEGKPVISLLYLPSWFSPFSPLETVA